jgi:molybdopterin-containing oxidoreductase family iron-sulfur binding subunit
MVYARCVGTRYCANNCPYTVRTFNWFDPEWPAPLERQLNPDVSTRVSGVMEKCTFCVQRIQRAERTAEGDGREVADGEIRPACAAACPAEVFTFGDLEDPESRVARLAKSPRAHRLLGDLGTQPGVIYLEGRDWDAGSTNEDDDDGARGGEAGGEPGASGESGGASAEEAAEEPTP